MEKIAEETDVSMVPVIKSEVDEEVPVDMTGIDIVDIIDRGHSVSVYVKVNGKEFAVNINGKTFSESSENEILRKIKKSCESVSADNRSKINTLKIKHKKQ